MDNVMDNQNQNIDLSLCEQDQQAQDIPFVIFKVKDNTYCVDSRYIETLIQMPEYVSLPSTPPTVKGVFSYRGEFVTMFDMRQAFGIISASDEFNAFTAMLDQRKEEHIQWVEALERSLQTGEEFTLSHDPHACAFGKWYDNFKSGNYLINSHMKKIDEPHRLLHHSADLVDECRRMEDPRERESRLKEILSQVKNDLMPQIVQLLDETKDVFRSSMFHEMVVVLREAQVGLVVDEVLRVEHLLPARSEDALTSLHKSPYLLGLRRSEKDTATILELDVPQILKEAAAG